MVTFIKSVGLLNNLASTNSFSSKKSLLVFMSELIVLNVITRSMFMDFKRSLNGNSIKNNNCACYRQVNPIFQSNLTFITIVNRPIGIDLQFDWTRKTATTKYIAKEIEEKETKASHLCTSRDSFATMVKIYGIP